MTSPPTPRRLQQLQRRGGTIRCVPVYAASTGWGLCAQEDVCSGDPVAEYLGEVITGDEVRQRMQAQSVVQPVDTDHYFMALTNTLYLDAREKGNKARFINHSCSVCPTPRARRLCTSVPRYPTGCSTSPDLLFPPLNSRPLPQPNCRVEKWLVGGRPRIGIFAINDIAIGDILSYDYQFSASEAAAFKCRCGAYFRQCRSTSGQRARRPR